MTFTGYSDRINHALAFVAKHEDRQVHRGTALPYRTHGANVGIILTRYARDDDTVIAGILQEVVADCVQDRYTRAMLDQRIGEKFGAEPLDIALSIAPRLKDESDIEFSHDGKREDVLQRLAMASEAARWVCAADALHWACSTLSDLGRTIDAGSVWSRLTLGREGTVRWLARVYDRLRALGFDAAIMIELSRAIAELEERARRE